MRQYNINIRNFNGNQILGRITSKKVNRFFRDNYIFIDKGLDLVPTNGYQAIITYKKDIPSTSPVISEFSQISELNDGDVVLIEKAGKMNVLYEMNSTHNLIFTTNNCNCNCIMCPQPKKKDEKNRLDFNLKLIDLLDANTSHIAITGGEPTLLGDDLINIILRIKKKLKKASITLLSNGIKFSNIDFTRKISNTNHADLQIDIPLYSDVDKLHNEIVGGNYFYQTVKGLYNLALFQMKIGIRVVVHKLNYKRLPQLAEYIYRNFPFVNHVALMQMETTGLANLNLESLWIDPYDYNEQLKESIKILHLRGINVSIYNSQLCILPSELWKFNQKTISSWKNIYVRECENCLKKLDCGGFFESAKEYHSNHIQKIIE